MKLFLNKEAILFKFTLPDDFAQGEAANSIDHFDGTTSPDVQGSGFLDRSFVDLLPKVPENE